MTLLGTGTDMLLVGGVSKIKGNTVEFVVDNKTSDFDGNDVDLAAGNTIAYATLSSLSSYMYIRDSITKSSDVRQEH